MVSHGEREARMKRCRAKRRRQARQPSLFHPPMARPSWRDLDKKLRREVCRLVARMLREYEEQDVLGSKEGSSE